MNRKERREAAHQQLKLDRKAGFPTPKPQPVTPAVAPALPLTGNTPDRTASVNEPAKPPISEAKLNANRANSQHSKGAVTDAGRSASAQNHTIHGLARHNGPFKVLAWEDAAGFEALRAALIDEHQPTTETESILVNGMVESHWLANRAQYLSNSYCDSDCGLIEYPQLFSLYLRYQTTHTRAFHKALNDLLKLRAERRKADFGFEAQKHQGEQLRLEKEKHEMKKEAHYWEVMRKDAEACHQIAANTTQQVKAEKENPGFLAQYHAELEKRGLQPNTQRCANASAA
jgi:hypothetical protein